MVVGSVAHHQQSLPRVFGLLHLGQAEVEAVKQRRFPSSTNHGQAHLNTQGRVGEVLDQFHMIVESNHKELVLWVCGLREAQNRLPCRIQLRIHRSREIEDDPNRIRLIRLVKGSNLLRTVVLVDSEVFSHEPGERPVLVVVD